MFIIVKLVPMGDVTNLKKAPIDSICNIRPASAHLLPNIKLTIIGDKKRKTINGIMPKAISFLVVLI